MRTVNKTIAIALITLAVSAGIETAKAQEEEQENFVWITNTDGIIWEGKLPPMSSHLRFDESIKTRIAQIVVPEHAVIDLIDVTACANLTNLIYRPPRARAYPGQPRTAPYQDHGWLTIRGDSKTGLRTIAMQPEMIPKTAIELRARGGNHLVYYHWFLTLEWTTNWQVGDPPKLEIRTQTTSNVKEVEVIWRTGTLQIANAVNGEWKDHNGNSPYRFPLASAKDMQFFRIQPEEEEEPELDEESQ